MFKEPTFPQPKPWENKTSSTFKKWLIEEAGKKPEGWSSDFLAYIEMRYKRDASEDEPSIEQIQEADFQRTLGILDLSIEDIRDKRILDAGCHDGGFVISSLKKNLTQEVFGLDKELEGAARSAGYQGHFYTGDFTGKLPINDLDHVLSVGAISLNLNEEARVAFKQSLKSTIESIKQGGDVRVGPVYHTLNGEYLAGVAKSERVLGEVLKELEEEDGIVWELKPTDISVTGNDKDVLLMQALIIKRQ